MLVPGARKKKNENGGETVKEWNKKGMYYKFLCMNIYE